MNEPNRPDANAQRRRVVVLAAGVACMSAAAPALMRMNRTAGMVWVALMAVALVYVIVQFGKAMRERNR